MKSNIQIQAEIKDKQGKTIFTGSRFETIGALNTLRQKTESRNKRLRNHKSKENFEDKYHVMIKGMSR